MERFLEEMRHYNFISSEISAVYHKLNVKLGISDAVSYILYTMYEEPGSSQNGIVRMTGLSKQTIHSAVQKMIRQGLLSPLKGQRGEPLVLTEKGMQFTEEKISVIVHIENAIFNQWDEKKQKLYTEMNEEYLNKLKEEVEKVR